MTTRLASIVGRMNHAERGVLIEAFCKVDPVAWVTLKIGAEPDSWQKDLLRAKGDVIACCGRRVGKTAAAAWLSAHQAVSKPNQTIAVVSPSLRQSREAFIAIRAALDRACPDARYDESNRLSARLRNGSRILSLPGEPSTIRGLTLDSCLLDEAQSLPDGGQELFAAIRPTIATTGGRFVVCGTPLDCSGIFFNIWAHAEEWTKLRVLTSQCPRVTPAFLETERRLLGEALFRREYLAEFSISERGYFDAHAIDRAYEAGRRITELRNVRDPRPEPQPHYGDRSSSRDEYAESTLRGRGPGLCP
jgi:phage terminase large subunit-like protein